MKKLEYSQKLKHPKWQKKRLEVLNRDSFRCTLCMDDESTLHVHHEEYFGDPWDADIDKLKTLCEHCHLLLTHGPIKDEKIVSVLKSLKNGSVIWFVAKTDQQSVGIVTYDTEGSIWNGVLMGEGALEKILEFINTK